MKISRLFFSLIVLLSANAFAAQNDDTEAFHIDLSKPLPTFEELQKKYPAPTMYDKHYDYSWNIGNIFDKDFKQTIHNFGQSEKRLPTASEENLLEMLAMFPKEIYPYIGPYLHTIPGMSEKVLNLPGIKETKNKFPEKIDKKFQNIEGLEFLSPAFYFLLIPKELRFNRKYVEKPLPVSRPPKAPYDPHFFANIQKMVPISSYQTQIKKEDLRTKTRSAMRTIRPTANSLVTGQDMRAVSKTLNAIHQWNQDPYFLSDIFYAGRLLNQWELDHQQGISIPNLKDIVNPCSRLVQKLRIINQEKKLSSIVARQGFTVEEWGYTCDKTIRAYRNARLSSSAGMLLAIYRKNIYHEFLKTLPPKLEKNMRLIMKSISEMYQAPLPDTMEALRIYDDLYEIFRQTDNQIIGIPVYVLD